MTFSWLFSNVFDFLQQSQIQDGVSGSSIFVRRMQGLNYTS